MSLPATNLTFQALRDANMARLPGFKNKHGEFAHSRPDGSDWSPAQWLQAVVGELGEFANLRKKFERGDISPEVFAVEAAKELADVQTYLDILAMRCLDTAGNPHPTGVDLGRATIDKFNEVSERVGSPVRLNLAPLVCLTGHQLLAALDLVAPDRETDPDQLDGEVLLAEFEQSENVEAGLYAWDAEYPEEGVIRLVADGAPSTAPCPECNDKPTFDSSCDCIPFPDMPRTAIRQEGA